MKEQTMFNVIFKEAKEKGFQSEVLISYIGNNYFSNTTLKLLYYTELQKWLREEHKIDLSVFSVRFTGHEDVSYYSYSIKGVSPVKGYKFKNYEQALAKEIQEALKLI